MFLHTLEVDVPTAPDPSAPNEEVTVSELAYGAFDVEKFHRMCDSKSDDYDANFAEHLDAAQREIFWEGTLWAARQVLTSVVAAIGKRQGWAPRKDNVYTRCNCFGNPRSTTRKISGGHLAIGCTYCILLLPLKRIRVQKTSTSNQGHLGIYYTRSWFEARATTLLWYVDC